MQPAMARRALAGAALSTLLAMHACTTPVVSEIARLPPDHPRVFSVGEGPVLTFDNASSITIPIWGTRLTGAHVHVSLTGTSPLEPGVDFEILEPDASLRDHHREILIKQRYLTRVRDLDRLAVAVSVVPQAPSRRTANVTPGFVPTVQRRFTLRRSDDFRTDVLATTVPYHDVRAFPMSEAVVEEIFGSEVSRYYLVVAARIYNRTKFDKVVTAGMITARGRAVIFSDDSDQVPIHTVPVEVSPQSTSMVYTHVDDEQTDTWRQWIIRSVKFVGALATGVTQGFDVSEDAITSVAIFTGIAIPEGERLWPNRIPGYLANIFTYGMPDLIKVPAGASAGGVLFFHKRELHSMVMDPSYSRVGSDWIEQPHQFIAGLELNSLEVFFENTVNPAERSAIADRIRQEEARARAATLGTELRELDELRGQVEDLAIDPVLARLEVDLGIRQRLEKDELTDGQGVKRTALGHLGEQRTALVGAASRLDDAKATLAAVKDAAGARLQELAAEFRAAYDAAVAADSAARVAGEETRREKALQARAKVRLAAAKADDVRAFAVAPIEGQPSLEAALAAARGAMTAFESELAIALGRLAQKGIAATTLQPFRRDV